MESSGAKDGDSDYGGTDEVRAELERTFSFDGPLISVFESLARQNSVTVDGEDDLPEGLVNKKHSFQRFKSYNRHGCQQGVRSLNGRNFHRQIEVKDLIPVPQRATCRSLYASTKARKTKKLKSVEGISTGVGFNSDGVNEVIIIDTDMKDTAEKQCKKGWKRSSSCVDRNRKRQRENKVGSKNHNGGTSKSMPFLKSKMEPLSSNVHSSKTIKEQLNVRKMKRAFQTITEKEQLKHSEKFDADKDVSEEFHDEKGVLESNADSNKEAEESGHVDVVLKDRKYRALYEQYFHFSTDHGKDDTGSLKKEKNVSNMEKHGMESENHDKGCGDRDTQMWENVAYMSQDAVNRKIRENMRGKSCPTDESFTREGHQTERKCAEIDPQYQAPQTEYSPYMTPPSEKCEKLVVSPIPEKWNDTLEKEGHSANKLGSEKLQDNVLIDNRLLEDSLDDNVDCNVPALRPDGCFSATTPVSQFIRPAAMEGEDDTTNTCNSIDSIDDWGKVDSGELFESTEISFVSFIISIFKGLPTGCEYRERDVHYIKNAICGMVEDIHSPKSKINKQFPEKRSRKEVDICAKTDESKTLVYIQAERDELEMDNIGMEMEKAAVDELQKELDKGDEDAGNLETDESCLVGLEVDTADDRDEMDDCATPSNADDENLSEDVESSEDIENEDQLSKAEHDVNGKELELLSGDLKEELPTYDECNSEVKDTVDEEICFDKDELCVDGAIENGFDNTLKNNFTMRNGQKEDEHISDIDNCTVHHGESKDDFKTKMEILDENNKNGNKDLGFHVDEIETNYNKSEAKEVKSGSGDTNLYDCDGILPKPKMKKETLKYCVWKIRKKFKQEEEHIKQTLKGNMNVRLNRSQKRKETDTRKGMMKVGGPARMYIKRPSQRWENRRSTGKEPKVPNPSGDFSEGPRKGKRTKKLPLFGGAGCGRQCSNNGGGGGSNSSGSGKQTGSQQKNKDDSGQGNNDKNNNGGTNNNNNNSSGKNAGSDGYQSGHHSPLEIVESNLPARDYKFYKKREHGQINDEDFEMFLGNLSHVWDTGGHLSRINNPDVAMCVAFTLQLIEDQEEETANCTVCLILDSMLRHFASCIVSPTFSTEGTRSCQMCLQIFTLICIHINDCNNNNHFHEKLNETTLDKGSKSLCTSKLCLWVIQKLEGKDLPMQINMVWIHIRGLLGRILDGVSVEAEDIVIPEVLTRGTKLHVKRPSRTSTTRLPLSLPSIPENETIGSPNNSRPLSRKKSNLASVEENKSQKPVHTGTDSIEVKQEAEAAVTSPTEDFTDKSGTIFAHVRPETRDESEDVGDALPTGQQEGHDLEGPGSGGSSGDYTPSFVQPRGRGNKSLPMDGFKDPQYFISVKEKPTGIKGIDEVVYADKAQLVRVVGIWEEFKSRFLIEAKLQKHVREEGVILKEYKSKLKIMGLRYNNEFQWIKISHLGNGMTGKCHLAKDFETDFMFCVKEMHISHYEKEEITLWSELDHPFIVQIYGAIRHGEKIYILQEFIAGGCLTEAINAQRKLGQRLGQRTALRYFKQLLEILVYLQNKNIMHEDIKADNILLNTMNGSVSIKMTDFGLSRRIQGTPRKYNKLVGTQTQWSPEKAKAIEYSFPAEVWAAVCVLVHVLSGVPPWIKRYQNLMALIVVIVEKSPPVEDIPANIDGEIRDLILQGFTLPQRARPSASDLLRHPAFVLLENGSPDQAYSLLPSMGNGHTSHIQSEIDMRLHEIVAEIDKGKSQKEAASKSQKEGASKSPEEASSKSQKEAAYLESDSTKEHKESAAHNEVQPNLQGGEDREVLQPSLAVDPYEHLMKFFGDDIQSHPNGKTVPPSDSAPVVSLYMGQTENGRLKSSGSDTSLPKTSDELINALLPKFEEIGLPDFDILISESLPLNSERNIDTFRIDSAHSSDYENMEEVEKLDSQEAMLNIIKKYIPEVVNQSESMTESTSRTDISDILSNTSFTDSTGDGKSEIVPKTHISVESSPPKTASDLTTKPYSPIEGNTFPDPVKILPDNNSISDDDFLFMSGSPPKTSHSNWMKHTPPTHFPIGFDQNLKRPESVPTTVLVPKIGSPIMPTMVQPNEQVMSKDRNIQSTSTPGTTKHSRNFMNQEQLPTNPRPELNPLLVSPIPKSSLVRPLQYYQTSEGRRILIIPSPVSNQTFEDFHQEQRSGFFQMKKESKEAYSQKELNDHDEKIRQVFLANAELIEKYSGSFTKNFTPRQSPDIRSNLVGNGFGLASPGVLYNTQNPYHPEQAQYTPLNTNQRFFPRNPPYQEGVRRELFMTNPGQVPEPYVMTTGHSLMPVINQTTGYPHNYLHERQPLSFQGTNPSGNYNQTQYPGSLYQKDITGPKQSAFFQTQPSQPIVPSMRVHQSSYLFLQNQIQPPRYPQFPNQTVLFPSQAPVAPVSPNSRPRDHHDIERTLRKSFSARTQTAFGPNQATFRPANNFNFSPSMNPRPPQPAHGVIKNPNLQVDIRKASEAHKYSPISQSQTAPVLSPPKTPQTRNLLRHASHIMPLPYTQSDGASSPASGMGLSTGSKSQFDQQEEIFRQLGKTAVDELSQHSDPVEKFERGLYDFDDDEKGPYAEFHMSSDTDPESIAHYLDKEEDGVLLVFRRGSVEEKFRMSDSYAHNPWNKVIEDILTWIPKKFGIGKYCLQSAEGELLDVDTHLDSGPRVLFVVEGTDNDPWWADSDGFYFNPKFGARK
ncbi:uncharacterized protein LOC128246534 [Mya arenaria]|uniref:uncharacterized protein LOC128246534 n=1 Tax=Mya arenaria TaxID=6604 RepID=UPI0022E79257|nr:uncharacterized protein LOC128246534 [Mya arenaria]XP_052820738.1 uncharacterized protein LOC128246534 [Mya arenaria]XP_052820739.1 uncharacterized protein LOC128246534 [Mya arenaria]XP_052820740.1 uncharacterized protein LOC128246534 [Mya arenaria]